MEGPIAMADATVAPGEDSTMAASADMIDLLAAEPSEEHKAEWRMATKTPSEWLRLLCPQWSKGNESIVAEADAKFVNYKSYLNGQLTSQLLCRLSITGGEGGHANPQACSIDFWKILGVDDVFDRAHIVSNVERFCSLYNIRGGTGDEHPPSAPAPANDHPPGAPATARYETMDDNTYQAHHDQATATAAAVVAGISQVMPEGVPGAPSLLYHVDPLAAAAAFLQNTKDPAVRRGGHPRKSKEEREREREFKARKAAERAAQKATREEKRQRKIAMRRQREEFSRAQKEAALLRAAELVKSNRVPIEITKGAAATQAAAKKADAEAALPAAEAAEAMAMAPAPKPAEAPAPEGPPPKKLKSNIVVSTASDLDQIVTHSNNLWAKYNAIAKEHNQKVNWIVVAKELGIHVKVREKYARMHSRAKARGFDFVNNGHFRIRDYPQYFLDPLGPSPVPIPLPPAPAPTTIEEPTKVADMVNQYEQPQQQFHQYEQPQDQFHHANPTAAAVHQYEQPQHQEHHQQHQEPAVVQPNPGGHGAETAQVAQADTSYLDYPSNPAGGHMEYHHLHNPAGAEVGYPDNPAVVAPEGQQQQQHTQQSTEVSGGQGAHDYEPHPV